MKYTLDELCDFINGGAWSDKEYVSSGLPVLKVTNCKPKGFALDDIDYLPLSSAKKYDKNKLKIGDVIIATVGSHPNLVDSAAGRSCIVNSFVEGYYLNQNAVCIRTKNSQMLDQKYLGYLTKHRLFQHYIQMRGKGAASQMRIAIGAIKSFEFDFPEIDVQQRIGSTLSAYDDLIENNQKQIKLLEEAAQRLYTEWFIDLRFPGHESTPIINGTPKGWKRSKVEELIGALKRTKQIQTSEYQTEGRIPVIDQSREFIAGYTDDIEAVIDVGRPIIVFGDHTRVLKYIPFAFARGADGTQLVLSNDSRMPQSLLYCSLKELDLTNYHYARHFKHLKASTILVPSFTVANEFDNMVETMLKKIDVLRQSTINAQRARDALLPRIMSITVEV